MSIFNHLTSPTLDLLPARVRYQVLFGGDLWAWIGWISFAITTIVYLVAGVVTDNTFWTTRQLLPPLIQTEARITSVSDTHIGYSESTGAGLATIKFTYTYKAEDGNNYSGYAYTDVGRPYGRAESFTYLLKYRIFVQYAKDQPRISAVLGRIVDNEADIIPFTRKHRWTVNALITILIQLGILLLFVAYSYWNGQTLLQKYARHQVLPTSLLSNEKRHGAVTGDYYLGSFEFKDASGETGTATLRRGDREWEPTDPVMVYFDPEHPAACRAFAEPFDLGFFMLDIDGTVTPHRWVGRQGLLLQALVILANVYGLFQVATQLVS